MPIKNPTPELLETIRKHGKCDKTGVVAQWGYHAEQEAKVFLLSLGEKLPKGWVDSPSALVKSEQPEAPKAETPVQ